MSDSEDVQSGHKKRRLQNACDQCRKRKSDSAISTDNICSNCSSFKTECTHDMAKAKKKTGPIKGQPRGLRPVQATVEAILSAKHRYELPNDSDKVRQILVDLANHIRKLEEDIAQLQCGSASTLSEAVRSAVDESQEDVPSYSVDDLTNSLRMLEFDEKSPRHFGDSSNITLVKAVMVFKKLYAGDKPFKPHTRRTEFWTIQPWQKLPSWEPPPFEFPPDDLMTDLVDLYFVHLDQIMPIVHRPMFTKFLAEGLHHKDRSFGGLLLVMCAVGSLFSDDPRIFEENTTSEQSVGWKYIRQIQPLNCSFVEPASIYDIQMYVLYVLFMGPTTTPEISWILISVGVRLIQDVGAHRKQRSNSRPSAETESWKRAFWVMYTMDILTSSFLGRPRSISQDDFDADLPIECDEEYWEHTDPELAFQQPPGKPSTMSYWISFLKLMTIMGSVLRTIYGINQSDIYSAMGLSKLEWHEKTVAELDSSLNKWIDEIPEHLKWDPNRENMEHFRQSTMLYTTYYWIQILVHRSFIPGPGEDSLLNFPSLAICCNASRSCISLIDTYRRRPKAGMIVVPNVMMALFNSCLLLLINAGRGILYSNGASLMALGKADVHKGITALHHYENRWTCAGRFADTLVEVISVSHFHPPSNQPTSSLKRAREPDEDNVTSSASNDGGAGQRRIAGRSQVSAALESTATPISPFSDPFNGSNLPLHSSELGSLPVFEHVDWSTVQNQWFNPEPRDPSVPNPILEPGPSNQSRVYITPEHVEGSQRPIFSAQELHSLNDIQHTSASETSADWASYMASVDEVLRSLNTGGSSSSFI
ncbi:hypothetical protein BT96DRAFT_924228 [Gymnopus androsaceus JB14]|uniref:Xylanolytic transcriptional activator regulatory domain-containing protein n=1 Tax=Gymnopus androsaceus JB14 TaxID=1447944 RepID=A0A6A4H5X3_9AGAR|nr:hypothetical protein BT96DRAFT_924228 [Gymnopus androsaceus JB14]